MNPHDHPGLVIVESTPAPQPGLLTADQILAEPAPTTGEWVAACVRRLQAMSTGPVAVDLPAGPQRDRLEAAGVLTIAGDASIVEARDASWPTLPALRRVAIGYGSPRPTLVVVGDSVNRPGQRPFASRSGTWLLAALRHLGYDELTLYLCNAHTRAGERRTDGLRQLHDVLPEAPLLAAGRAAEEVLSGAGLPYLHAPHPSQARRFRYASGPEGYARELLDGGVERVGDPLDLDVTGALPELPEPYALRSVAYGRGGGGAGRSQERHLEPTLREEARRLYVLEGLELKDVAERIDVGPDAVRREARHGDWRTERDEHQREATERAKREHQDRIARDFARLRVIAPAAALKGYELLLRRMESGELQVSPSDVKALVQSALAVHEAQVVEQSDDERELSSMRMSDLVASAQATLDRLNGREEAE